ncbi:MAG: PEGA domain-containing protein [bacterium]
MTKAKVFVTAKKVLFGMIITVNVALVGISVWILCSAACGVRTSEHLGEKTAPGELPGKSIRKEKDAAYISLNTHPSGAKVFINGYFKAKTPADIKITSVTEVPRQYSIKMILPGYQDWAKNVVLTRGKTKEFSVKLAKK